MIGSTTLDVILLCYALFRTTLPLIKRRIPSVEIAGIHIVPRLSRAFRKESPNLLIYTDGERAGKILEVCSKDNYYKSENASLFVTNQNGMEYRDYNFLILLIDVLKRIYLRRMGALILSLLRGC